MTSIGAPDDRAAAKVSTTPPAIDWYLVGMDSTAACLFLIGLFALLVGLPALGLGLWAACVWLDWRVLAYVRTAPGDPVIVRQYVRRRVTTDGIAQVLAVVFGLCVAASGQFGLAFGIWAVAAGGIVCSRMLGRVAA